MWEHPLSYIVLEFFTWNPAWDQYLTRMMEDRLKKEKESCSPDQCSSGCGGCPSGG